ncbi:MAG: hypothetical protein R3C44_12050 [Chloroflexota bacterium]
MHYSDWEGLTTFFGFAYFGGDRTHFDGVRILRPATHYRLAGNGRVLEETHCTQHALTIRGRMMKQGDPPRLFEIVMGELTSAERLLPISGG